MEINELPLSCIFLIGFLLVMGFFTTSVYSVFIWFSTSFNLFRYLTWNYDKWSFGFLCTFMNKLTKDLERSHMPIIGFSSFLWNVKCMHVGSFPWRWNIAHVHKFNMGFKESIMVSPQHKHKLLKNVMSIVITCI
jgi:hypothetical protein